MLKALLLDLDGTVYAGTREIPNASWFIRRVQEMNIKCLYVTNRANRTPEKVCEQLLSYGIACKPADIVTSALATVRYIGHGSVFLIGEEGMRNALLGAGMTITDHKPDYVIISYISRIIPEDIEKAAELIRAGAKFIGTNPDKALSTESGIVPGTGSIVEAVQQKCNIEPTIIGKPGKILIDMALKQLNIKPDEALVIGDNLETDIPAGEKAGVRTVLMLTGISTRADSEKAQIHPDWIVEDFNELYKLIQSL